MSLDPAIKKALENLKEWKAFPKYALERRIDIFLTPFLAPMVSKIVTQGFGASSARLVAPEFPILSDLLVKGANASHDDLSARTANVDYLFKLEGAYAGWVLLELKTDVQSFKASQAHLYALARERGMKQLIIDVEYVQHETRTKVNKEKYSKLLGALGEAESAPNDILVTYLGPSAAREKMDEEWDSTWVDEFVSLKTLKEMDEGEMPLDFRGFWPEVQQLITELER